MSFAKGKGNAVGGPVAAANRVIQNENIISGGGNPMQIETLKLMMTLTDSICKIDTGHHTGTGYMVRIPVGSYGDLYGMLTNHHVLGHRELGAGCTWGLEFEEKRINYNWSSHDWCYVYTDQNLDCTFVVPQPHTVDEMDKEGIDFMPTSRERVGEKIGIIQHPQGGALSFSYGKVVSVEYNQDLFHNADTLPGSSGSPLINERGEVIGLHKAWERESNLNLATKISAVIAAITRDFMKNPNLGVARRGGPVYNRDPRTGKPVTKDPALCLRQRRSPTPPRGNHSASHSSGGRHGGGLSYPGSGAGSGTGGRGSSPGRDRGQFMGGSGFDMSPLNNVISDLDSYFQKKYPTIYNVSGGFSSVTGHGSSGGSTGKSHGSSSHGGGDKLSYPGRTSRRPLAPTRFPIGSLFGFESCAKELDGGAGKESMSAVQPNMPMPMPAYPGQESNESYSAPPPQPPHIGFNF